MNEGNANQTTPKNPQTITDETTLNTPSKSISSEQPEQSQIQQPDYENMSKKELQQAIDEKKKQIEKNRREIQDALHQINNIGSLYNNIVIEDQYSPKHAQTSTPTQVSQQGKEKVHRESNISGIAVEASSLIRDTLKGMGHGAQIGRQRMRKIHSSRSTNPDMVKIEELEKNGQTIKNLCNEVKSNIDTICNPNVTAKEASQAFIDINNNIKNINQQMKIQLKSSQHLRGNQFDKAESSILKNANHVKSLGDYMQKNTLKLNSQNSLVPEKLKSDFGKIAIDMKDMAQSAKDFMSSVKNLLSLKSVSIGR